MKSFVLVCLILIFSINHAVFTKEVKETINKNCTFVFNIPDDFTMKYTPGDGKRLSFQLNKGDGRNGILSINVDMDNSVPDASMLKEMTTQTGNMLVSNSTEKNFTTNEIIVNDELAGYCTSVLKDDKSSNSSFKKLITGLVLINGHFANFNYFFNEGDAKEAEEAVNIIKQMQIIYVPTTYNIKDIALQQDDLPGKIKIGGNLISHSKATSIYYEDPAFYKEFFPVPKEKIYQTFSTGDESGSVIYLIFDKQLSPDEMKYIDNLIHERQQRSAKHPEEVFCKDNLVIIYCFNYQSKLKEQIKAFIGFKI